MTDSIRAQILLNTLDFGFCKAGQICRKSTGKRVTFVGKVYHVKERGDRKFYRNQKMRLNNMLFTFKNDVVVKLRIEEANSFLVTSFEMRRKGSQSKWTRREKKLRTSGERCTEQSLRTLIQTQTLLHAWSQE